jgi:hypothetical protein
MFRLFVRPQRRTNAYLSAETFFRTRLSFILATGLASPLMIFLLPLSLTVIRRPEGRVLWLAVMVFLAIYSVYPGYVDHYTIQINGVMTILLVGGIAQFASLINHGKTLVKSSLLGGLIGTAAAAIVVMPFQPTGAASDADVMEFNYISLPKLVKQPALVLFRYGQQSSPHTEPVYNLQAAWPDDCSIVRAHDLGAEKDLELFRYYASIHQDRYVYRFDRDSRKLESLGRISELVNR